MEGIVPSLGWSIEVIYTEGNLRKYDFGGIQEEGLPEVSPFSGPLQRAFLSCSMEGKDSGQAQGLGFRSQGAMPPGTT